MIAKKKCPFCDKGFLSLKSKLEKYKYKNQNFKINQIAEYCSHCSESIISGESLRQVAKEIHDWKAKIDGFLTSSEIKEIRKKLKLTQKDAAKIFGGGPNGFSRYENGEALQLKATDNLLRILNNHPNLLKEIKDRAA